MEPSDSTVGLLVPRRSHGRAPRVSSCAIRRERVFELVIIDPFCWPSLTWVKGARYGARGVTSRDPGCATRHDVLLAAAILIAAIVLSGLLGGAVNFLISGMDGSDTTGAEEPVRLDWRRYWLANESFWRSLVMGVAAAFVVPLFLQVAAVGSDSGLVYTFVDSFEGISNGTCAGDENASCAALAIQSIGILIGFCVVAAVSSRNFLESMAERVMREAKESAEQAKRDSQNTDAHLAAFLENFTTFLQADQEGDGEEPEPDPEEASAAEPDDRVEAYDQKEDRAGNSSASAVPTGPLDEVDRQLIEALLAKPRTRRSIKGMRESVPALKQPRARDLRERLRRLVREGYATVHPPKGESKHPRWMLGPRGWTALNREDARR